MAGEAKTPLGKYVERGWLFLMALLAGSLVIFFFSDPHDPGPFLKVVEFGVPAWFGLNAVERWAVDRPAALRNGSTGSYG